MDNYIYIVLSKTNTLIGKTIRKYLGFKYSHSSISLDKELLNLYSFARKNIRNPFIGGLIKETPYTLSSNLNGEKSVYVKIFKVPVDKYQLENISDFIYNLYEDEYYYDVFGLITIVLKKQWKLYKTYICSEFVMDCLELGGFERPYSNCLISPKDIGELLAPFEIFEGNLFNYTDLDINNFSKYSFENTEFFKHRKLSKHVKGTYSHLKLLISRHRHHR